MNNMQLNKARYISDLNVRGYRDLPSPAELMREMPLTPRAIETVFDGRMEPRRAFKGRDNRMIVVVGGCSEFDPDVNAEMTQNINWLRPYVEDVFILQKRTMVEKPRTKKEGRGKINTEWAGVVYDPDLNGSRDMNKGIRLAREMLLYCAENGVASVVELVNPIIEQYISDLVSIGVVGARSVSSPSHRDMATGSSAPLMMKNGTDGDLTVVTNGLFTIKWPSAFPGIAPESSRAAAVDTKGNKYSWMVLRGGDKGPNYNSDSIAEAVRLLEQNGLRPKVFVDTNHGNSGKNPQVQPIIFLDVVRQRAEGNMAIMGTMSEVNPVEGRQDIPDNLASINDLKKGQSVTDAGLGWHEAKEMILEGARLLRKSA